MNLLLLRRRAIRRRLLVKKQSSSCCVSPHQKEEQATAATTGLAAASGTASEEGGQEANGSAALAAAAATGAEGEEIGQEEVYEAVLDAEASKHCLNVLRVQVGDSLRVGVFNGGTCEGKVVEVGPNDVVKIRLPRDIRLEPPAEDVPLVDLVVALPRPKTLDKILQVAATLGVGRLLLVCARRSERAYFDSPKLSIENICKQLRTGLEQGVATRVPEVHVFASWVGLLAFLQPCRSPCALHASTVATKSGSSDGTDKSVRRQTEAGEEEEEEEEGEETPQKRKEKNEEEQTTETEDTQRQQNQEQHEQPQDEQQQLLWRRKQQQGEKPRQYQQKQNEQQRDEGQELQRRREKREEQQMQQQPEPPSAEVPWCCFSSRVGRSRRLLAHPDAPHSLAAMQLQSQSAGRVLVAVGPEGGWLPEEVQELQQQQQFVPFHLGNRVLRCETAVVSILAQVNLLLTDPTLRNGLPPPTVEGSFPACLASQSAAESARSSHSGSDWSNSCSSSISSSIRDETKQAAGAHHATGTTVRSSSSSSTRREDSSLSERTCKPPPANCSSPRRYSIICGDGSCNTGTCTQSAGSNRSSNSGSINSSTRSSGSSSSVNNTATGSCSINGTRETGVTSSNGGDDSSSSAPTANAARPNLCVSSLTNKSVKHVGECGTDEEGAVSLSTVELPASVGVNRTDERDDESVDIFSSPPECTSALAQRMKSNESKTVVERPASPSATDLDTYSSGGGTTNFTSGCFSESRATHYPAVRVSTNVQEFQNGVQVSPSPSESTSSPAHCLSYTGTASPHREAGAVRYKTKKATVSSTSDKDGRLNRKEDYEYNCSRGTGNRMDNCYRKETDEHNAKRHNFTETAVSLSAAEKGRGHGVAREERGDAEQVNEQTKEGEGEGEVAETQNEESSAVSSAAPAGGAPAIAAAAARHESGGKPAGVAAARAREGRVGRETVSAKTELNTGQGLHRGRRLFYKDEDGFFIVLPERRHAKTDEQNPA